MILLTKKSYIAVTVKLARKSVINIVLAVSAVAFISVAKLQRQIRA